MRIYIGKKFGTVNLKQGRDKRKAVSIVNSIRGFRSGKRRIEELRKAGLLNTFPEKPKEISPLDDSNSI
jgi:hypothetical protein